ncbi:hypothetical protein H5410_001008, partial [Solanum commersonii]
KKTVLQIWDKHNSIQDTCINYKRCPIHFTLISSPWLLEFAYNSSACCLLCSQT